MIGGTAFGIVVFMPLWVSANKPLTVLVVTEGGSSQVTLGTSSSDFTVHFDDGSTQVVNGKSVSLIPVFQSTVGSGKNPTTMDVENKVFYAPKIDLSQWCINTVIPKCPIDAALVVTSDLSMTANGQVVWTLPTGNQLTVFTTIAATGSNPAVQLISSYYKLPQQKVYVPNTAVDTLGGLLKGWDVTPYRQTSSSVTVALSGKQHLEMHPVYCFAGLSCAYDNTKNLIQPIDILWNEPSFSIPPITVTNPDYALSIVPQSLTMSTNPVNSGNLGFVTAWAQTYNSLTGTFHVGAIQGLPTGVTTTFETPNDPQATSSMTLVKVEVRFTVAQTATAGNYTATIPTTLGAAQHSISLLITITGNVNTCPSGAVCGLTPTYLTATLSATDVNGLFPFTISGKLLGEGNNAPVLGAVIYAHTSFSDAKGQTGSDGAYSITMFAPQTSGSYTIQVSYPGDSQYSSAEPITLQLIVRPVNWTIIIIIIAAIAVLIVILLAVALTRKKPGMP